MARPFISAKITGWEELDRKLTHMAPALIRQATKNALSQAAKVVAAQIAAEAPEDTGFLHEHISFKASFKKFFAQVKIGPTKDKYPNRQGSGKKRPRG